MKVVLLAGGKGRRMHNEFFPKVLMPIARLRLIDYALDNIKAADIDSKPVIVTGFKSEEVEHYLREEAVEFVKQPAQLGTGHAVSMCKDAIDNADAVMVLCGDHPLIRPDSLRLLSEAFKNSPDCVLAMMTYTVPYFDVYDGVFRRYGRIIRDKTGNIAAIREFKDASTEELEIKEVNPAFYVFKGSWLWENLPVVSADNAQGEYYLTDLVEIAIKQNHKVLTVPGTRLEEAIGVNTPEQLKYAEQLVSR